ncbi:MAG: hypothetical protein AMJ81_07700 [Phycisphaerae bacterium SM23_33]|nr:MAG: hypothetical protein AMJ81_07700 [Phycisphaerae bacterium SM23_33]
MACLAAWPLIAVLAGGCRPPPPDTQRPKVGTDPCAERLHDVCGHLLLYYQIHKRLPPTLKQLKSSDVLPLPPLVCPVSGKPYVYEPQGLLLRGQPGRLVLYDPEPSHSGIRWGILVGTSARGDSIIPCVIAVTEEQLASATTQPAPEPPDKQ